MRTGISHQPLFMFSSRLPKPVHSNGEVIRVTLPKPESVSTALIVESENFTPTPSSNDLKLSKSQDYTKSVLEATGGQTRAQMTYEDTVPLKKKYPYMKHHFPRYSLQTCPDPSLRECLEGTREVMQRLLAQQLGTEQKTVTDETITYVPPSLDDSEEQRGRTIQITTRQEDPMLPPKHKLRKNRHQDPSPPPPLLKKAPTEKVTKEIKDKWAIPSVVSNWSNNKGFSISLRKRQEAASGGQLAENASINVEKFSLLALALENADEQAREEIKIRNEERRVLAQKEQEEKERKLKELVTKTRDERDRSKRPRDDSGSSYNAHKRRAH